MIENKLRPAHELSLSSRYEQAVKELITRQENGITVFKGGPLDFAHFGKETAWLTPVLAADEQGHTAFHILYLNTTPEEATNLGLPVELNVSNDICLKLGDVNCPDVQELNQAIFESSEPRIMLRPSISGNLTYPAISTPDTLALVEDILRRANQAVQLAGHAELCIPSFERDPYQSDRFIPSFEAGNFVVGEPRRVQTESGIINVYGVNASASDSWKYYEIMTPNSLEQIDRESVMTVRVDSGCDIGQCYHDGGCDCRYQLLKALDEARTKPGMVVHIPSQDGRGYGMVSKMATEGGKRGIDVGYNQGKGPMDTITAATELLGPHFDIRSYEGVGYLLGNLGFKRVSLMTDSKLKLQALENTGLEVMRIPTGTENGNHRAHNHVRAKHANGNYF